MAITFDSAIFGETGSAAELIRSHTLGSGSNRVVYAAVHGSDATFTATYNGTAMTELYDGSPGSPFQFIAVFVIKEADLPAAGTYNVVFTPSSNQVMACGVMSFAGVDQTTPNDAIQVATANSDTPSVTVSSAAGDLVIDFVSINSTDAASSAGAGQTARLNQTSPVSRNVYASQENGGASIGMTWTLAAAANWTSAGLNLNAAAGGSTAVPVFVQQMKSQGMA